jgi:hypothetical protein
MMLRDYYQESREMLLALLTRILNAAEEGDTDIARLLQTDYDSLRASLGWSWRNIRKARLVILKALAEDGAIPLRNHRSKVGPNVDEVPRHPNPLFSQCYWQKAVLHGITEFPHSS